MPEAARTLEYLVRSLIAACLLVCAATETSRAQQGTIHGSVRDAQTGEPLRAATIRMLGTTRGTITNAQGEYRLSLEPGRWTVVVSYVGFETDSTIIDLLAEREHNVRLQESAVQLAEVLVIGEDPAMGIMRKVIANKNRWKEGLTSYRFSAFTRQVIRRDTAIAQITESHSAGFWQEGDSLREHILQQRQTNNVPIGRNFAAVGGIVNMYDDDIKLAGFSFVGPTSVDAFDYYRFSLQETRRQDGRDVYVIKMEPRSSLTPLFAGVLSVAEEDYALTNISVTPNETFTIPFISKVLLTYGQQFRRIENTYWLPVDIRITGTFEIAVPGLTFPPFGIESNSAIYEYQVNVPIPDSIAKQPRKLVVKDAARIDTLFWNRTVVIPLTGEESSAYAQLDSSQTLDKQFAPSGPLAALDSLDAGILGYLAPRYNRVEGFYFGFGHRHDSTWSDVSMSWHIGYGLGDGHWNGEIGVDVPLDSKSEAVLSFTLFRATKTAAPEQFITSISGIVAPLFAKKDYWDYYYAEGWSLGVKLGHDGAFTGSVTLSKTFETSARKNTDWSILYRHDLFRDNPQATEASVASVITSFRLGKRSPLPGLFLQDFVEGESEIGVRGLGGELAFQRFALRAEWYPKTLLRRTITPAYFAFRVEAGIGSGSLPLQRAFSLDGAFTNLGPIGTFRSMDAREFLGDRYAAVFIEHNFRTAPFLWLGLPGLHRAPLDLVLFGSTGRCWSKLPQFARVQPKQHEWYSEIGIGLSRIMGLIRLDVARRLVPPEHYAIVVSLTSPL